MALRFQPAPTTPAPKPNDMGGEPMWTEPANTQRVDVRMVGRELVVEPHVRKPGRPASGKQRVTMLLDPDVIAKFKATGAGWQSRINDVLKTAKV